MKQVQITIASKFINALMSQNHTGLTTQETAGLNKVLLDNDILFSDIVNGSSAGEGICPITNEVTRLYNFNFEVK